MTPPTITDVGRPRTHISSIPWANLSVRVVNIWHRSRAKVNHLLGHTPPVTCSTHESTHYFPHEIAEMIVAHLIHDLRTLKACSLTCRSWYIIAVPHIHHTLIVGRGFPRDRLKPLSKLHGLGLTPLVREIRVERLHGADDWFIPQTFGRRSLRYLSAFTNVHTLGLQRVELSRFFPHIERYFRHFSPTLRSIVLSDPHCTPQQLSYFLSLFQNLDDIKIWGLSPFVPSATVPDATPVPFSTPNLRGLLSLGVFDCVETWTHLIASCGSLRFRRMELYASVSCAPTLLEACAETLETLRFHATDGSQQFDLSQLRALRSLQVVAWVNSYGPPRDPNNSIVTEVFSTITSPIFSELVVVLSGEVISCLSHEVTLFQTLCEMHKVRPFELVFLFEGPCSIQRGGRWESVEARCPLKEALDYVSSKGFLDFLNSPPTIRTIPRSRYYDWNFSDFD